MSSSAHSKTRTRKNHIFVFERTIYCSLQHNSRRRKIEFRLSYEDFLELIYKNCVYCGKSPSNEKRLSKLIYRGKVLKYQGIDRKDNSKGYILSNVVPCCKECNSIKGELLTHDEMICVASAIQNQRASIARGKVQQQLVREPITRLASILLRRKGNPQ